MVFEIIQMGAVGCMVMSGHTVCRKDNFIHIYISIVENWVSVD